MKYGLRISLNMKSVLISRRMTDGMSNLVIMKTVMDFTAGLICDNGFYPVVYTDDDDIDDVTGGVNAGETECYECGNGHADDSERRIDERKTIDSVNNRLKTVLNIGGVEACLEISIEDFRLQGSLNKKFRRFHIDDY